MSVDFDNPDGLSFESYEKESLRHAFFPRIRIIINDEEPIEAPWLYPLLGLVGETGELAEKFKKAIRDQHGKTDFDFMVEVEKEAGDVLWYLNALANRIGVTLRGVAYTNLTKLSSRALRGVLGGSGDNR